MKNTNKSKSKKGNSSSANQKKGPYDKKPYRHPYVKEEPKKDSSSKRVNFDNARVDKVEKGIRSIAETDQSNDVSWYASNPELLRAAASLPFSTVTGDNLTRYSLSNENVGIPGIMALYWSPSIGGDFTDPINQAADSVYSYVVHANSRRTSYVAEDLMLTILGGANLFSFIAHGIRAYGVARMYDQRNSYLPDGLLRMMGFDPQDIRKNLSQIWFDLNEIIARSNQIWIPNNMPIIERWFWLNTNIFQDSESIKGQYYLFCPDTIYAYSDNNHSQGTSLINVSSGVVAATGDLFTTARPQGQTSLRTWQQYMNTVNLLFDQLINSEFRGVMFGDILKAYGADKIYALKPIPVDYTVVPVYDKEVLTQIENCMSIPAAPVAFTQDINSQRIVSTNLSTFTNYSGSTVTVSSSNDTTVAYIPGTQVLNFHQKETPSPEQIMVATRLKPMNWIKRGDVIIPATAGSEIIDYIITLKHKWVNNIPQPEYFTYSQSRYSQSGNSPLNVVNNISAFDWAPWVYYTSADKTGNVSMALGDWDNWTSISSTDVMKMHQAALYSEFGVPVL